MADLTEESSQLSDHLKVIFDLCDVDTDGVIAVEDFRRIALEHFGRNQQIEVLISELDPDSSGHITFTSFCQGVETYLFEKHSSLSPSSSLCSLSSFPTSRSESFEADASVIHNGDDDIYPVSVKDLHYLTNGYSDYPCTEYSSVEPASPEMVDAGDGVGGGEVEGKWRRGERRSNGLLPMMQSSPAGSVDTLHEVTLLSARDRDSPVCVKGRQLLGRRHSQLALPDTPLTSQGGTPAELVVQETEEEVSRLSDQLHDLSSKLEDLEEDQKYSDDHRKRLERENTFLKRRLEESEDQLRESELTHTRLLSQCQTKLHLTVERVKRESEQRSDELSARLQQSREELERRQDVEAELRLQCSAARLECESKDAQLEELESVEGEMTAELRRAGEQLREERRRWEEERDGSREVLQEREHLFAQLRSECEEVSQDKKRTSITASDMGREVERLKKVIDKMRGENEDLQAQFVQQGRELLSRNHQSLAAEMEKASKDEVLVVLKTVEERNQRLHIYIDGLLLSIIEKHPDLLEKR